MAVTLWWDHQNSQNVSVIISCFARVRVWVCSRLWLNWIWIFFMFLGWIRLNVRKCIWYFNKMEFKFKNIKKALKKFLNNFLKLKKFKCNSPRPSITLAQKIFSENQIMTINVYRTSKWFQTFISTFFLYTKLNERSKKEMRKM